MRWFEIKTIFLKDFLELVRKPASLLLGILLPGFFMPVFVLSINDIQGQLTDQIRSLAFTIGFDGESEKLKDWFQKTRRAEILTSTGGGSLVPGDKCDAVLVIPAGFDEALASKNTAGSVGLRYDSMKENSMLSLTFIAEQLLKFKESIVNERLKSIGIVSQEQPSVKYIDIDEERQNKHLSRYHGASFLLLLVFSIYVAASAAASETITAERERNTLEALLLTPTGRETIVRGKLLLTLAITVAATLLTMVTYSVKYQIAPGAHLSALAMLQLELLCLPLLLMLALTVVSMSMLLASYARSVQQSMGYSFYLALALFGAAGLAFNPGVSLASPAAFMPVSGLSIAIVDILSGRPDWFFITIATVVGVVYCTLFTLPAAHLLQSDESLYNLQVSPQQRLREGLWARPLVFLFVGVFLGMFYISQAALQWKALPGLIVTQLVCVLAPALLFLKAYGLPFKETLSWRRCRLTDLVGAACLSPFTVIAASWLFEVQSKFLPAPEEFFKAMNDILFPTGTPLWQILPTVALAPAICEEILFRGVFQGLLSRKLPPRLLIPSIGLIFGAFHFSLFRFVPTAILGCLLSFLVVLTESVFPSMALHLMHNGLSTIIQKQGASMPVTPPIIAMALFSAALGGFMLSLKRFPAKKTIQY